MAQENGPAVPMQNAKLREVLQGLLPQILKHRSKPIGEQNTKAMLIEPILDALGWNTRDCDEVHHEYRFKRTDSPVDYAMIVAGTPRLFLEAKGLGENPADRKWVSQVLGYATTAGVEWCVVTTGDEWRFYKSTAAVDAEEKLFLRVGLSDSQSSLDEAVATLALLSRENTERNMLAQEWTVHQINQALAGMLKSADKGLVRLLRNRVPELSRGQLAKAMVRLNVQTNLPARREPDGKSLLELAAKVLAETKKPMKCHEMVDAARAKGWETNGLTPWATLSAAILREIQTKGDRARFRKVGPGEFELVK